MILPKELIEKVEGLKFSSKNKEIALHICADLCKRKNLDKYTPLQKQRYLKLIDKKTYDSLVKKLVNSNIVEFDFYVPNKKSRYYKLKANYTKYLNYKPANIKVAKMENQDLKRTQNKIDIMPKYLIAMSLVIKNLKWDFDEMKDIAKNYIPTDIEYKINNDRKSKENKKTKEEYTLILRDSMEYAIANLEHKRFNFYRDNTSKRLHTNITNIKNTLYQTTKTKLVEIDIKNSQPYFLSILLSKISKCNTVEDREIEDAMSLINSTTNKGNHTSLLSLIQSFTFTYSTILISNSHIFKSELNTFTHLVTKGIFYDYFISKFNVTRDEVKVLMFEILFSKNSSYRQNKKMFIAEFPMINQIIESIKFTEHSYLAIILQSLESYVMIDVLCKRLVDVENIIPITKHDSVAVDPIYTDVVYSIVRGTFVEQCDSVPTLHIKPLN